MTGIIDTTPASPASGAPVFHDSDIVARLEAEAPAEAPETEPIAPEAEPVAAEYETEGEPVEESEPAVPAPASWAKEHKEAFAQLPPEVQKVIVEREGERERAVNAKLQEAAEARKAAEERQQFIDQTLTSAIQEATAAIQGDFAGIDFLALKRDNPQLYLQVEAAYQMRMQQIQGLLAAKQAEEAKAQTAQQKQLETEAIKTKELVKSMFGETAKPAEIGAQIRDYLISLGVAPTDVVKMSTSTEFSLVAKAMLYDQEQSKRANAATRVAEAPKVDAPKTNANRPSPKAAADKAKETLLSNPNSTDALVDFLNQTR